MKLILIGNHTCGNRGDAAILRGLLEEIKRRYPAAEITVTSRYPVSSSYLLDYPVVHDPFDRWHRQLGTNLIGKLKQRVALYAVPMLMMLQVRTKWGWLQNLLPAKLRQEIDSLRDYDAVVQVGGSFFVDLYGPAQFEYPMAAILSGRPLLLAGHSIGPFGGRFFRALSDTLIRYASEFALRESVSRELAADSGLPVQKLAEGSDTAWLVSPREQDLFSMERLGRRVTKRAVIAITVRELAPFNQRLNTTQEAYEQAFAALVNRLIDEGYDVVAASTCTGIDNYHRDDRMNALRVAGSVSRKEHYHVVMDELNDIELGCLFRQCELVIGTRLHSAIIALNFGTPAIALNYEHKSAGVMRQLGMECLSKPVSSLLDGSLADQVVEMLPRLGRLKEEAALAVHLERMRASEMVSRCLDLVVSQDGRP